MAGTGLFAGACRAAGIADPVAEYRFHATRKWRFDYAWPVAKIALEVEGGAFTQGRHTRGRGFLEDMDKYNAATLAGWRILRVTPANLLSEGIDMATDLLRRQTKP